MTRSLSPIALFLLLAAAAGAQLSVSPERLVSAPDFAPPLASAAVTATSASGSIVAFQPFGRDSLWLQRLDANLQPLTPHGVALVATPASTPRALGGAASDGSGYVVLWKEQTTLWSSFVSLTGALSPPRPIAATQAANSLIEQPRIASNGSGCVALWADHSPFGIDIRVQRLDTTGAPVGNSVPLTTVRSYVADIRIASNGHQYLVAVEGFIPVNFGSELDLTLIPVAASGTPGDGIHTKVQTDRVGLAYTGATYVLAWQDNLGANAATVDASGHLGPKEVIGRGSVLSVAGGSNGALVILRENNDPPTGVLLGLVGVRIDSSNVKLIGTNPIAGTTPMGTYFAVALAPDALRFGAAPPAFVDPPIPVDVRPLVTFAVPQEQPRIAAMGELRVAAWREGLRLRATRLRAGTPLDSPALVVSDGAINSVLGSNHSATLIAWQTFPQNNEATIAARLLHGDGSLSPTVAIATVPYQLLGPTSDLDAVVWAGQSFVVVWHTGQPTSGHGPEVRLRRARFDGAGNIVAPAAPLGVPPSAEDIGVVQRDAALVRTGDGFLLVYDELVPLPVGSQFRDDVFAMPFHAEASPSGPRQPVSTTLDAEQLRDAATDGNGHVLAVWSALPLLGGSASIWSMPLDERGAPAGNARRVGDGADAHVTWTGSAFLIVRGAPPFPTPTPASNSVAAIDTILYTRSALDLGLADADRVFVRTITPPRRRAVVSTAGPAASPPPR